MFLSDFSIRRPVAMVVIIIALMSMGLLALTLGGAALVYLGAVWAAGLNPRQFLRR